MFVSLFRIIKYGIQSFLRNGWLSASTISIMALTLLVFEGLIIFNYVGQAAISAIQDKVDISVYFKSNVPEDTVLSVKRSLENLEEVKFVEYVSREDALLRFKDRHAGDEAILQTLGELDSNPLLAALNIKAKELEQYGAIASYLETPTLKNVIEKVTYGQNKLIIERLSRLVGTLNQVMLVLTAFLTFLAVMVTFNTIRLAIFSNREQISIMRLVGASNSFIRGPFVVEGIIYGIAAAIIGFVFFLPVINISSPYVQNFIPQVNLKTYLISSWLDILGKQMLFALAVSVLSSAVAIRRYLRV